MQLIHKILIRLMSIFTIAKYKAIYGKSFSCSFRNRVASSLRVRICGGSIVIGNGVSFRENCSLNVTNGTILIGKDCFFNDFVCLNARLNISIGDNCIFGQSVKVYDHDHDYHSKHMADDFVCKAVEIKKNTWVGSDAVILKGAEIGEHCVIGAKSLVKHHLDNNTLYYLQVIPKTERITINDEMEKATEEDKG